MSHVQTSGRPAPDPVLVDIAEYASSFTIESDLAYQTARHCLRVALCPL